MPFPVWTTKMKLTVCVFVCVLALTRLTVSGLTICKPLSKFRLDCNVCTCSSIGVTYTCTDRDCYSNPSRRAPSPQNRNSYVYDADNDFYLTDAKPRKSREQTPYLNDEIPPSGEVDGEENFDVDETNVRQAREQVPYASPEVSSSQEADDDDEDDEDANERQFREDRVPYKYNVDVDNADNAADNEVDDEKDALDIQKELQEEAGRINLNQLIERSYLPQAPRRVHTYERVL